MSMFPFSPVLVSIGPIPIRWDALAYIAAFVIGWRHCLMVASRPPVVVRHRSDIDDFLGWGILAVAVGGRAAYMLFYRPHFYFAHPAEIVEGWNVGMSVHGSAVGLMLAIAMFTRRRHIGLLGFADVIVCALPIGLFFGRMADFIDAQFWGRVTDMPWAMVFPTDPRQLPRHPSQLYEALLEGIALFTLLLLLRRYTSIRKQPGALSGVFLMGYASARIVAEFFRQPDAFLGFVLPGITMGQLLSAPLLALGLYLFLWAYRLQVEAVAPGQ
jgi:phosphatidylglycerol:prolipoprotein diacylglycerol transferase